MTGALKASVGCLALLSVVRKNVACSKLCYRGMLLMCVSCCPGLLLSGIVSHGSLRKTSGSRGISSLSKV